ncbi:MAG: ABC transporter ATP-binding protein [Christensenellales bacterium]
MLAVSGLTVRAEGHLLLEDISFQVAAGDWLMLVGPNGAGKSTLLSALSQGVKSGGSALFQGEDLRLMKPRRRASCLGVLNQQHSLGYAFSVLEVVRLGRYAASGGLLGRGGDPEGGRLVAEALRVTGLTELAHQRLTTLSGGELQRVFLAQLFAQDPRLLLLDEPANHLDLAFQQGLFTLLGDWLLGPGRAIISVVHDLSLARRYGTQALLLDRGRAAACGTVAGVLRPGILEGVYGMDVFAWMREMLGQWQE